MYLDKHNRSTIWDTLTRGDISYELTFLKRYKKTTFGVFKCSCGKVRIYSIYSVYNKNPYRKVKSCGHLKREMAFLSVKNAINGSRVCFEKDVLPDDKTLGYICGLIATDGHLDKNYPIISIGLQASDEETLFFLLRSILDRFGDKTRYFKNKQAIVKFTAPKLYQYCLDMGITPKKSLTLDVRLEDKSDDFKRYFLRGVIDGDGCVYVKRNTEGDVNAFRISICTASAAFKNNLVDLFNYLSINPIVMKRSYKMDDNHFGLNDIYHIQVNSSYAKDLAKILPKDPYFIRRKTDKLYQGLFRYNHTHRRKLENA